MRELIKKMTPETVKSLYRKLRSGFIKWEFGAFSHLPIQKKRVVFCNVWGYGDNPKWIARALRYKDKSLDIIFVTDTAHIKNPVEGIKYVQTNSPRAVYYLSTAHVWVDCNRKEAYICKRTGQFYIQTWHGSLPLKKIEGDCSRLLSEEYMDNARRDSSMADLFLSNSEFCNDIYRSAFEYQGAIEITGSPRVDALLRPSQKRTDRLRKAVAVLINAGRLDSQPEKSDSKAAFDENSYKGIRIAVYAPTFRDGSMKQPDCNLDYNRIIEALEKRFGGRFVIFVRLHPLVAAQAHVRYSTRVLDGNEYGDLYGLLEAADVLITDYSNTLFEFSYSGRPVFLLADDSEEYEENRGFYFDYESLPYPHARDVDELCECVGEYDANRYAEKLKMMFENLGIREDGRASVRAADLIIKEVYRRK